MGRNKPWLGRRDVKRRAAVCRVRRHAVKVLVLVIWLPLMTVSQPANAAPLRMPSRAAVRSALEDIWSWLTDAHASTPKTPSQETGTAAGRPHQVPAAVTRAVSRAQGHAPGIANGQLPAYSPHAPISHQDTTGAAPDTSTFNPATSKPVTSATTATSDLYQNTDGTYTRLVYSAPVNYQTASGRWAPIDTGLSTQPDRRWHNRANALTVSFAARSDSPALGELDGTGNHGPFGISFGLAGAAGKPGTVAGPAITYPGVLPATDLVETDTATGIAERLVLQSSQAPTTWVFPLKLTGLTPQPQADGSVDLVDSAGTVQGVIPAGLAEDSSGGPQAGPVGATAPVSYSVISYQGGPALQLSLDPAWLADPKRVFPVTVDPSYNATTKGTTEVMYPFSNDYSGNTLLQVGTYDGGSNYARSFLSFAGLGSALANEHITGASLHVWDAWAWTCGSAQPFWANEITQSWSVTGNKSWPGPATGAAMGELNTTAPSAACTNTSGNPSVGGWMTMGMDSSGLSILNDWTLDPADDNGIALTNSTTNNSQWKQFDSFNTSNAPYLSLTYTADVPPQIDSQYPPDNSNATSLTPELLASGHDPDNWPSPVKFVFTVYSSAGKQVASSGLISASEWTVPKGDLSWAQQYYWTVQDYDGLDYSATPVISYFGAPVPQPLITSLLSQNASGPGFDPASGNYTTSATDAQVSTVGPSLAVERDYNSLDPRIGGAFGAGWSSILDMRAAPGMTDSTGATDTVVVTYPDGEDVGFGQNANGSFTPPQGRFATFASASGGGYTLTDKNDTVYTFTQPLGSGAYGITSVTDALRRTLNFGYSGGQLTTIFSAVSGRALHVSWATPGGASHPHVASVVTDPASSAQGPVTWTYGYSADQLTSVCPPISTTKCTTYAYTAGSDYQGAVLDSGPHSYWPLDETAGGTAASAVLANEGADNATYSNVALSQPGPLAGSSATSAGFDGSSSYLQLPTNLVTGADYQSVSIWFKTTATNGVLLSDQADQISSPQSGGYAPNLYVGSDGVLHAEFWNGSLTTIASSSPVNDGNWHQAVISANGNTQTLYVDGRAAGALSGTIQNTGQRYDYVGAGFLGGGWPDEEHQYQNGNTGYATYFNGSIAGVGFWERPVTAAEVTAMYAAAKAPASLVTSVTRPSGNVHARVSYNPLTSAVSSVTDSNGGTWGIAAPSVTGSSQVYESSVLGADPLAYYRLADTGTTDAVNQVNGGTAVYSNVTQGVTGGPFSDATVDSFNGSSSYLAMPSLLTDQNGNQSVSLWFKTSTAGGVLFGSSADPITNGTTPGSYAPEIYLGTGGDINAEFWNGSADPMLSTGSLADGKWHNVVLTAGTSSEVLYVDGQQQATLSGTVSAAASTNVYLGTGFIGGTWPHEPHQGQSGNTGYATYFNGDMSDVAYYTHQLTAAQVTAQYQASKHSSGLTPVEQVQVTDPGGNTLAFHYDPLNGNRLLSETDAFGATSSYGYDTSGFLNTVTDPNGDVTVTGHDVRGNVVSETTCQHQANQVCGTSYYSYYPDDTSASPAPDPRNDVMLTSRDARTFPATDNTYLTTYAYNSLGELTSVTTPPVPGFPSGRATSYAYTDGTTSAGGYAGAIPSAGLPYKETTPGGAVTTTLYAAGGDVAQVTDPDGLVTTYGYDGLGRVLSKTEVSNTFPNGLATTYGYNQMGQVVSETNPPVTDRVTGAVHTAQTSTTYDADGNVLSQTVVDSTGGDSSRTVSFSYDANDLKSSSTDATGAVTRYNYNSYGDMATQTDQAGNVLSYAYDADGRLDTVTLQGYTGDPANPSAPVNLVESSRAYDPAGRLASLTDSMGWVTSYGYTDDGLVASVTRSDPSTAESFTVQSNAYDNAGNLVGQATGNGATNTNYAVDAANQVTSQAVDPAGLNRVTSYSYSADNYVTGRTLSGAGSSGLTRSESWSYDPMGNATSHTIDLQGSSNPVTTSSTLDQRGLPTSMTDADGNVTQYAYDEAGRLAVTTSPAVTTQVYGGTATSTVPVTMTGYNTFGEAVESADANGNVAVTGYDAEGRVSSVSAPPYTPPGSSSPLTAVTSKTYNGLGQVTSETDPLGNKTTYTYDQLGDLATETAPDGGVTHHTYDTVGDQLSVTGPTGAMSQATYDYLGRKLTSTAVERYPSAASYTSAYTYATGGWLSTSTSPDGVPTVYGYNAVGETTAVVDGAGNSTSYGYDPAGDRNSVTYPDGTQTQYTFDGAGRQTGQADLSASGTVLRSESAVYDGTGNLTSSTDFRGDTTSYGYDATGLLTSETQPVTASSGITTSFGYDAAGNRTLFTDGNGNNWWNTYNSWNLPESRIEPATAAHSSAADSTFTTGYDADGRPVGLREPGGVSVSNGYDAIGDLTGQSGSGAEVPTASRTFGYDLAGNMTSASATAAGTQAATSESFSYNDRGLLLSASGSAGLSSFGYNGDGQVSSVASPAGTASFGYDNAGRLGSMSDPVTGTTLSYGYNSLSQVSQVSYGSGGDTRAFGYNALHQLTSDALTTSSGATAASIAYGYDPNGNLTSKTTTGFAGAAANTYSYDEANRLTSWNNGTATVQYAYDGAGNRVAAGANTYSYDTRDELTSITCSGCTSTTMTYTARGTMSSLAGPYGNSTLTADAYGQPVGQPYQTEGYDALGRLLSDHGYTGSHDLSYLGTGQQVSSDGSSVYSWDPSGNLTGIGSAGAGVLAWTDAHTDLVGSFTASGSLSGSATYDPWGNVTAASSPAVPGTLGFQSAYSGSGNGLAHMGSRWYWPGGGVFTTRDTAVNNPVPSSAAANPFAYVGDNPLGGTDPTGHMICNDQVCASVQYFETHPQAAPLPVIIPPPLPVMASAPSCSGWWSCGWHDTVHYLDVGRHAVAAGTGFVWRYVHPAVSYAWEGARALWGLAGRYIRVPLHVIRDVAGSGARVAGGLLRGGWQAGSRAYHSVAAWTRTGFDVSVSAVKTGWREVARTATATVTYVKHHATTIAAFAGCAAAGPLAAVCGAAVSKPGRALLSKYGSQIAGIAVSVIVFAGCEAAVGIPTAGVGAVAAVAACGGLAGAAGNATSYAITAAQHGGFSWSGLGRSAATGFVFGAVTAGLTAGAGEIGASLSGSLLRSGTSETADALATTGGRDAAESCAANSFTGNTKVLLPGGRTIVISKVKAGQKVEATDPYTGVTAARKVAKVIRHHGVHAMVLIALLGGGLIHATAHHPIYDASTRTFTYAADLHAGDKLLEPDSDTIVIKAVKNYTADLTAYNLDVTGIHTYYVQAGTAAILVHNSCDTVYRVIRPDEDPSAGLYPKNPDANYSVDYHVRFGKQPGFASQYISTTRNINIARAWASRSGNRIVSIDLSQAEGNIIDLSTFEDRQYYLLDWRGRGFAMKSEEVLIEGSVPSSAIEVLP